MPGFLTAAAAISCGISRPQHFTVQTCSACFPSSRQAASRQVLQTGSFNLQACCSSSRARSLQAFTSEVKEAGKNYSARLPCQSPFPHGSPAPGNPFRAVSQEACCLLASSRLSNVDRALCSPDGHDPNLRSRGHCPVQPVHSLQCGHSSTNEADRANL